MNLVLRRHDFIPHGDSGRRGIPYHSLVAVCIALDSFAGRLDRIMLRVGDSRTAFRGMAQPFNLLFRVLSCPMVFYLADFSRLQRRQIPDGLAKRHHMLVLYRVIPCQSLFIQPAFHRYVALYKRDKPPAVCTLLTSVSRCCIFTVCLKT